MPQDTHPDSEPYIDYQKMSFGKDSRDIVWVWYSIAISVSVSAIVGPLWVRKTINEMESSNESLTN